MDKRYGKRITKEGNKFYFELFYPEHRKVFMGNVVKFIDTKVFVVHIKKPDVHFYIKGQGYPINEELLNMLFNADIQYILIPERGKTGFKAWLGTTKEYIKGDLIHEPHTEPQRVIPLRWLKTLDIGEDKIKQMLA